MNFNLQIVFIQLNVSLYYSCKLTLLLSLMSTGLFLQETSLKETLTDKSRIASFISKNDIEPCNLQKKSFGHPRFAD